MTERPNIVLITTDQHRWDWLGCHGTPGVETPNLDRLAESGVRFTQAITNSTICVPARIGLATGVAPIRLGCLGNDDVLPDTVPTYYQLLRDSGYDVGVVGKLDLNKPARDNGREGNRPDTYKWGFTHPVEAEGKMHARGDKDGRPLGPYGWWLDEQGLFSTFAQDYKERMAALYAHLFSEQDEPRTTSPRWFDDSPLPADAFEDAWIGRRSCQWLQEVPRDRPFHLYVSFVGPHDPFDPPTEYADRFRSAPVPRPVLDSNRGRPSAIRAQGYGHSEEEIIAARRQYTAALSVIDDQVGAVLDTLDREGLSENTVIVFSADHGEMLGDHGLFQKHVPYEPSMRIPLIAAGPGIATGVSDALTELVDVTATMLAVAGIEVPDHFDGTALTSVLRDPAASHRDAGICCEGPYRAIRTRDHKYVHYVKDAFDIDELYDLVADPNETTNLIDTDAAIAASLRDRLTEAIGEESMAATG